MNSAVFSWSWWQPHSSLSSTPPTLPTPNTYTYTPHPSQPYLAAECCVGWAVLTSVFMGLGSCLTGKFIHVGSLEVHMQDLMFITVLFCYAGGVCETRGAHHHCRVCQVWPPVTAAVTVTHTSSSPHHRWLIIIIIIYPLTTDDFRTSFLHFSLFSTALWDLANSRPVLSLMLSSHLFLCLPCLLRPLTVPWKMVFAGPDKRETWPYHCSVRLFTVVRRSSCGPIACWILARTSSMVTWSLYEMRSILR